MFNRQVASWFFKGVISITIEEVEGARDLRRKKARCAICAIHGRAGLDEEPGVYERLEYCSAHEWFHVPEAAGLGLREAQARDIEKFAAHTFNERSDEWRGCPR